MTDKKRLIKRILFIVIPVVLVLAAVGAFLLWYLSPSKRVDRAFETQDYETVVEWYSKLKDEKAEEVQDRLIDIAKDYHDAYLNEKMKYKDAMEYYNLVMKEALADSRKARKYREEIETVYQSREDYSKAVEYMEEERYLEAIEYFDKVSDIDDLYRVKADENIEYCRTEYIAEVIDKADELIAEEAYEEAKDVVLDALDVLPDDESLTAKLNEIASLMYADIKGTWTTSYDFGDLIAAELGVSGYNIYFPAELIFEFTDDKMHMYVSEDSIKPALEAMTADEESMNALYSVAEDYGFTKFQADLLVGIVYGGSYAEFLMDQFGTEIQDALEAFDYETTYFADSRKIYVNSSESSNDNYYLYETDGSTLDLNSYTGSGKPMGYLTYSITLDRKLR